MYPNEELGSSVSALGEAPGTAVVGGPLTALVADDYEAARRLFVDGLRAYGGFQVVGEAADGRQALDGVAAHHPDLAVLDLAMPLVGGLDVIEEINQASPSTRIVVVSGFPGSNLEELVVSRGAAGYVRKRSSIKAVVDDVVVAAGALELAQQVLAETRRFPHDPTTPRAARRFMDEILERWDCRPAIDTLHLVLSEVVSNAVVHAGSAPEVAVRLLDGVMRVEVTDESDVLPSPREADDAAISGRGLAIVESEAAQWGAERRPGGGKVVWFDVPVFGPGGAGRPGGDHPTAG